MSNKQEIAKIAREIKQLKAELNKSASASFLLEQAAEKLGFDERSPLVSWFPKKMREGKIVYYKLYKEEVRDTRPDSFRLQVEAWWDVILSESNRDPNKIDINVLVEIPWGKADHSATISAKSLRDLEKAISDAKIDALSKIMEIKPLY